MYGCVLSTKRPSIPPPPRQKVLEIQEGVGVLGSQRVHFYKKGRLLTKLNWNSQRGRVVLKKNPFHQGKEDMVSVYISAHNVFK